MPRTVILGDESAEREIPIELDEIVRRGAQRMLQEALDFEVCEYVNRHAHAQDEEGRRQVVRNGYLPKRKLVTGAGCLEVEQPRVRDLRDPGDPQRGEFTSKILPPYLRRTKNIDELIPWLYLRGISTKDMQPALEAILGRDAKGLSANIVTRLTTVWHGELDEWNRRDLSKKEYVYLWADGIHFNIRLEEDRQCILVLMGATKDGTKELIAIQDGFRESAQSWKELLLDIKSRGLEVDPKIAIADGALGFWKAVGMIYPTTRSQRCWVHKTANILNKLPKHKQPQAKADIHNIWMAETRKDASEAFELFVSKYKDKYPKATQCVANDEDELLAFYDFPAEHWPHLRTTNPIESTFATVRHRHRKTKGSGSRTACLSMVFKLAQVASENWRRLKGSQRLLQVIAGDKFVDGILEERNAA